MPKVYCTEEYQKALKGLLKKGKVGKLVYNKARVAQAEAEEGEITTIKLTRNGENRIPNAQKYDLPSGYRLVTQRVRHPEYERVFLFVGTHSEVDKWLDNHRGYRWRQDTISLRRNVHSSATESEIQKLKEGLEKLDSNQREKLKEVVKDVVDLKKETEEYEDLILSHEDGIRDLEALWCKYAEETERIAKKIKELEDKQSQVEEERRRLMKERERMSEQQQQVEGDDSDQRADHTQAMERLSKQLENLTNTIGQIERQRNQVESQRVLLVENQQKLMKRREQCALQDETILQEEPVGPGKSGLRKKMKNGVILGLLIPLIVALAYFWLEPAKLRQVTPPTVLREESPSMADRQDKPVTLATSMVMPGDAWRFVGQVVTVKMEVKSTYDGLRWAFLLNSEKEFWYTHNFTVIIERKSAGEKYKRMGITNLKNHFKNGCVLLVTGKVIKYKDKKRKRTRYQILVTDPAQIKIVSH